MTEHVDAPAQPVPASADFQIRVTVLGAERAVENNYGPRTERDTLATLDIPVSAAAAYRIFQDAFAAASRPRTFLQMPLPEA